MEHSEKILISSAALFILAMILFIISQYFVLVKINDLRLYFKGVNQTVKELNDSVEEVKEDLLGLNNKLNLAESKLETKQEDLENYIKSVEAKLSLVNESLVKLEKRIKSVSLVYPTYEELVSFMQSKGESIKNLPFQAEGNKFICTDYADLFISEFAEEGYYSCLAILYFNTTSHALVAVKLSDGRIIYVEPQSNKIVSNLKIGEDYCDLVDWDCDWVIKNIKSCFDIGG
jgi:uncharacterized protein YoxC